jgi:putative intracellular protease/amidase
MWKTQDVTANVDVLRCAGNLHDLAAVTANPRRKDDPLVSQKSGMGREHYP